MSSRRVRKEGTIDISPKQNETIRQERVNVKNKVFVLTMIDKPSSILLYVGGYEIYCIDAQIFKTNDGHYQEEALLNKIRYDMVCSLDSHFKEGKDTNTIMLFLLTYIKNTFEGVKTVKFNDTSSRKCDNGVYVNLAAMKFFTTGKTWYEDRFHARIHPAYERLYATMSASIQSKKDTLTWEECKRIFLPTEGLPLPEEEMKDIYESSKTWQEFYKNILDKIGIAKLCVWFSTREWFHSFLHYVSFTIFSFQFLITLEEFEIPYEILPPAGGRRGISRRRRRKHH